METAKLKLANTQKGWGEMIGAFQAYIDSEIKCFVEQLMSDAGEFQANYEAENDICFDEKIEDYL